MKKINIFISILVASLMLLNTSCIAKDIKGNGKLVTKSISISNFSKIEIETYFEINYSQGTNTGNLEFTIDENLWEHYDIHTKGDVLCLKCKQGFNKTGFTLKPTKSLITVSSEQLEKIEIAGSSKFNFCTAFASEELEIEIAGSGKVFADKHPVKVEELEIEIAGSGNVQLTGAVQTGKIQIAGSGNVNALNCKIARLSAEIAGSGRVEASVTDKLNADIAGSGSVTYKGNPDVTPNIAGSGKVKKL
jgi:hypothetical protein